MILLACALVALFVANQFIELADDVHEGETRRFDRWAVQSLRRADDPAMPIGPAWLREVGIDLTELGSDAIILLVIVAVVGFVALKRQ